MQTSSAKHVLMLLENNPYPQDIRVRREAITLTQAGYRVTVIAPRHPSQPWHDWVDGVQVYRFPAPPEGTGLLGYLWEYGYALVAIGLLSLWVWVRHGLDVMHLHNPPDMLALIALFYKGLGKQVVFDHHDLAPAMYCALFGDKRGWVYRALVAFERLACRLADHVIATNHSYRHSDMRQHSVPAERITVVRNGPDPNRLKPMTADPTLRQSDKLTLGYVGEMGFHDGLDYLLRSLQHLVYDLGRTDLVCLLVGDGVARASMERLSQSLQLTDYIRFIGRVPHDQVVRYLNAVDICLAPEPANSYNNQSTMIKILEYMAVGKPIVAFDLPEHRCSAQAAAAYAQPNDPLDFARQIAQLLDDPATRARMGEIGRERVERELAWSYQAEQLLAAYQIVDNGAVKSFRGADSKNTPLLSQQEGNR